MEDIRDIEKKISRLVNTLPPLPHNVEILLEKEHRQEKEAAILEMIRQDPGLCVNLLHLANSCFLDLNCKIDSIDKAMEIVGVEPFCEFMGISYVAELLHQKCEGQRCWDEFIQHSQEIALACPIVGKMVGLSHDECELYTIAGLLHDMGRLVIFVAANKLDASLLGTSHDLMNTVIQDENKALGMNHCQVGMRLCSQWDLPDLLEEGLERHHTPLVDDDFSFPGALIFISHFVTFSDLTGEIINKVLPEDFLSRLGLKPIDLDVARQSYFEQRNKHKR